MKIDRRALLKSGAAVSTAALIPGLSPGALSEVSSDIERFVFDSRFPAAVEAARSAALKRIQISEVSGDMTSLWYDDLNLRWKQQPMTLAGVTAEDALFVLRTLAPEYRMRVQHEVELGVVELTSRERAGTLPLYAWIIAPNDAIVRLNA